MYVGGGGHKNMRRNFFLSGGERSVPSACSGLLGIRDCAPPSVAEAASLRKGLCDFFCLEHLSLFLSIFR